MKANKADAARRTFMRRWPRRRAVVQLCTWKLFRGGCGEKVEQILPIPETAASSTAQSAITHMPVSCDSDVLDEYSHLACTVTSLNPPSAAAPNAL